MTSRCCNHDCDQGRTCPVLPPAAFNDDDWYVFDAATRELVQHYGRCAEPRPHVPAPLQAERGLRVKYLNLWKEEK